MAPARLEEPLPAPQDYFKANEPQLAVRTRREHAECSSQSIPAPKLRRKPRPSPQLPARRWPACPARSRLLTARRARVEPGELGERPGPHAVPTLHTRSPTRAPVYSVLVYVGLTV